MERKKIKLPNKIYTPSTAMRYLEIQLSPICDQDTKNFACFCDWRDNKQDHSYPATHHLNVSFTVLRPLAFTDFTSHFVLRQSSNRKCASWVRSLDVYIC